jgi:PIN domain nuclease of toxin-antitoxin system
VKRVLLDTNQLIFLAQQPDRMLPRHISFIQSADADVHMSLVSFWEIQIKHDARKPDGSTRLPLKQSPADMLQSFLAADFRLLPLSVDHIFVSLNAAARTADPFDQLLLKQCQVEKLKLLTSDARLYAHPLVLELD